MDYHNPDGYYSKLYGKTYYDGYGYNYYYGNYGYYEYSRPPSVASSSVFDSGRFVITLGIMVLIMLVYIILYYKCETKEPKKVVEKDS